MFDEYMNEEEVDEKRAAEQEEEEHDGEEGGEEGEEITCKKNKVAQRKGARKAMMKKLGSLHRNERFYVLGPPEETWKNILAYNKFLCYNFVFLLFIVALLQS